MNRRARQNGRIVDPDQTSLTPGERLEGPDNIYLNISVSGALSTSSKCGYVPFQYSNTFPETIVEDVENYYLTLIRAQIPLNSIGLITVHIKPGSTQTNPNLTDYSFCFTYSGTDYYQDVIYVPQNNYDVPPPPSQRPPTYTQIITPYYYLSNYEQFKEMLNTALTNAFNAMYAANTVALNAAGITANDQPYFIYDDSREIFSLVYKKDYVTAGVELYMNDGLQIYFGAFNVFDNGFNQPNGKNYRFRFIDSTNNNNEYSATENQNKQSYRFTPGWLNTVARIIITSNSLNVNNEWVQVQNNSGGGNEFGFFPIIYDLEPLLETNTDSTSDLVYNSQLYRLIDIKSTGNVRSFDCRVQYVDRRGNIEDLCIPPGITATLKFAFVKKSLFKDGFKG